LKTLVKLRVFKMIARELKTPWVKRFDGHRSPRRRAAVQQTGQLSVGFCSDATRSPWPITSRNSFVGSAIRTRLKGMS